MKNEVEKSESAWAKFNAQVEERNSRLETLKEILGADFYSEYKTLPEQITLLELALLRLHDGPSTTPTTASTGTAAPVAANASTPSAVIAPAIPKPIAKAAPVAAAITSKPLFGHARAASAVRIAK